MRSDPLTAAAVPHDRLDRRQIEVEIDGECAFAAYSLDGPVIDFAHTFVPEGLRGRGIATRLVEAGLAMAREQRLLVIPGCAMFSAYMRAHPETHDLLAPEGRALV